MLLDAGGGGGVGAEILISTQRSCVCVCVRRVGEWSCSSLPPSLPPSFPTMHLAVLPLPRVLVPVGNEEGALAADYAVHPLPAFLDWLEGREGGKECELLASFIHLSLVQARRSDRLILHFHPSFLAPSLPSSLHSSTPVFVSVGKA